MAFEVCPSFEAGALVFFPLGEDEEIFRILKKAGFGTLLRRSDTALKLNRTKI